MSFTWSSGPVGDKTSCIKSMGLSLPTPTPRGIIDLWTLKGQLSPIGPHAQCASPKPQFLIT